jgi:stage II sporulation protein D
MILRIIPFLLFLLLTLHGSAQVKIRLFTEQKPENVIISITQGKYVLDSSTGDTLHLSAGEPLIIARYNGRLAVKVRNRPGFVADSVILSGLTGNDRFSAKVDAQAPIRRNYTGNLKCIADLNTILMINICDPEEYIAGVVRAEGGSGKNTEYFKSQAVLARTYMYKYMNKHITDGYNLCDNTHCQAFAGLCSDEVIIKATRETKDMVVLDRDSILIISAFHSNCGGETASSEDVWLNYVPYLRKVRDPYCSSSRNASWQKSFSGQEWLNMIRSVSHSEEALTLPEMRFSQLSRMMNYKAGPVSVPLTVIRSQLNLRSTFFSVNQEGDSIILKGRGYGHGVGLCQEGAMAMASQGFSYRQIIEFYFPGVFIADISKAVAEQSIK